MKRVLIVLTILVCSIYLGELCFMRYRFSKATKLVNSVQELKIGITSSDEVRQLSERFGGTFYPDEGPDAHPPTDGSYLLQVWSPHLLIRDNVFSMKGPGLRLWLVGAYLHVVEHHLSRLSLSLVTKTSSNLDLTSEVTLTTQMRRAPDGANYYVAQPHVTGPPTEALRIEISPKASLQERKNAFDFNTNCLMSFWECRHVCEVSPSAWKDLGEHQLRYGDGREKIVDAECRQSLSRTK